MKQDENTETVFSRILTLLFRLKMLNKSYTNIDRGKQKLLRKLWKRDRPK